jgi:MraZ protein
MFDVAFRGTFEFTLDAKNRLTVPAKFRAVLADGVVLARGSGTCAEIWPASDYEALTARALGDLNPLSREGKELKRRLFASAFDTELDAAGRVMLPVKLIEHAGLGRDVSVLGAGEWLEVWDRATWLREDELSPDRVNELTARFDHPS